MDRAELRALLDEVRADAGRLMHESWARTMRLQGFHGPERTCGGHGCDFGLESNALRMEPRPARCYFFHADLIPWAQLPEHQRAINDHAFDAVFEEILRRVGEATTGGR